MFGRSAMSSKHFSTELSNELGVGMQNVIYRVPAVCRALSKVLPSSKRLRRDSGRFLHGH